MATPLSQRWDSFTLTQLVVLLFALGETIYVHYLCSKQKQTRAVLTDRNVYFTLQLGASRTRDASWDGGSRSDAVPPCCTNKAAPCCDRPPLRRRLLFI